MNKRIACFVLVLMTQTFFCFNQADAQIELNNTDASFIGENAAGAFGYSGSSIVGDIDGDGFDDIAIGAPREHYGASLNPETPCEEIQPGDCGCGGIEPGIVYVVFGKPGGWQVNQPIREAADLIFVSPFSGTQLGIDIAGGEIDGDGSDALIIGARGFGDDPYQERGKVYVLFGKSRQDWTGLPMDVDPDCRNREYDPRVKNIEEVADASFFGEESRNYFGNVVTTEDLNGDGMSEILIGAYGFAQQGYLVGQNEIINVGKGKVYVIFGAGKNNPKWDRNLPVISVSDATFTGGTIPGQKVLNGLYENILVREQTGFSISGLGDIDGDGSNDFIVGQQKSHPELVSRRQAYMVSGSSVIPNLHTEIQSAAATTFTAPDYLQAMGLANLDSFWYTDSFGSHFANAGDINHDGRPDFIIGSEGYSRQTENLSLPRCGAAYVFFGRSLLQPWENRVEIGIDGQQTDAAFYGTLGYAKMGLTVAGLGDVNGDNIDDFMIGGAIDKEGNAENSGILLEGGAFDYARADAFVIFGAISPLWSQYPFEYLYRNETAVMENFYPGDFSTFKTQVIDYARNTYRYFLGEETGKVAELFPAADKTSAAGFVSGKGDVNGDGINDLLIADYLFSTIPSGQGVQLQDEDIHKINKGKVYIKFGDLNIFGTTSPEPWMKDSIEDIGKQPNYESNSLDNSPAVWIRLEDDNGTTHQDPKYRDTENGELPVYIYVNVGNRGTEWTDINGLHPEKIQTYWADQSQSISWPVDFHEVETEPKPVGRMAPGASKIVKFEWFPPNPSTFSQWPDQTPHLTFIARIETQPLPPFGMAFPETSDVWENVKNNNTIAAKKDVELLYTPIVNFTTASQTVSENQSPVTISCHISIPATEDVIIHFTVTGTAAGGGVDHDLADGQILIPTGQTEANIVFNLADDEDRQSLMGEIPFCEDDETVIVTMGNIINGIKGKIDTHIVTIQDDDQCPVRNMETEKKYPKIQEAESCDYTLNGHTLMVSHGTYLENVQISKSVHLVSDEGLDNTFILADGNEPMKIISGNVSIEGFTLMCVNGKSSLILAGGSTTVKNIVLK